MSTYLDTRDLAKRKEELEALRDAVTEAESALDDAGIPKGTPRDQVPDEKWPLIEALDNATDEFGEDEQTELAELEELESEISEWRHGETLIPCDQFTDYARELLEDCGDIPRELPHYLVIDWNATAENLLADYSEVTYQGTDYYVRN